MEKLIIGGQTIPRGKVTQLELPVAKLYTDTEIAMPVHIVRARKPGPTVLICAAMHGDELNGIEIIRRLIAGKGLRISAGTVIAVPMINVYGILSQSRYMPDRRDLNRSFPGSAQGSMAGRVAHQFFSEIVKQCDYGIDLHTGAIHRSNLPQIRADLSDPETRALAEAFGVPVLLNATLRDGSLRESATAAGVKILLYEAGEALRFDELSIRAGVRGIANVLAHLGMTRQRSRKKIVAPFEANTSAWVRASGSGIVRNLCRLGDHVNAGDVLAEIGSPFGVVSDRIVAPRGGIIIGRQNIPLVQEGDAMFHIAYFDEAHEVAEHIGLLQDDLLPDDEDGYIPD